MTTDSIFAKAFGFIFQRLGSYKMKIHSFPLDWGAGRNVKADVSKPKEIKVKCVADNTRDRRGNAAPFVTLLCECWDLWLGRLAVLSRFFSC